MRSCLLLVVLLGFTESLVEFTHSVLLDQYDVFQVASPPNTFSLCKSGCSMYASIPPDATDALKEARNVVITDMDTTMTLLDIASKIDSKTSQLIPLEFSAKQREISIQYTGTKAGAGPVLLYIFSNTGKSNIPFEVYEARSMKRPVATAGLITILSPEPYNVGTEASELGNTVYSYAAGMDNAIQYAGPDNCVKVFELNDQGSFPGFILNVQMPLLSFFFNMDTPVEMYTRMEYSTVTDFEQFLSSPGFIGCYGMQVYTSSLYADSLEHTVSGESIAHLIVDATLNLSQDYPVRITDVTNNKEYNLWGDEANKNDQQQIEMDSKLLHISWKKKYTRSAFLLRFTTDSPNVKTTSKTITTAPGQTTTSNSAVANSIGIVLLLTALFSC